MYLSNDDLRDVVSQLAKRYGSSATLEELDKKLCTAEICYSRSLNSVNLLKPCFRENFLMKNCDFMFADKVILRENGVEERFITNIEFSKDGTHILVTDINRKKCKVPYTGENVVVKMNKFVPIDLFLKMM